MNNYIFYFSGTGNSLYTAKLVNSKIEKTKLVNITKQINTGYEIEKANTIGFVIPVYVFGAPIIVEEFITKLKIKDYNYLYILFVHGGAPYSATTIFKKQLVKAGFRVDAGYEVISADNYIEGTNTPTNEESINILFNAKKEIELVVKDIEKKKKTFPKTSLWKRLMGSIIQPFFKKIAKKASQKFVVSEECNGCGNCEKLCPRKVISINKENRPEWTGTNCEMCFACINLCHNKAIDIGTKTIGRNRYKNPEINISELFVR